MSDENGAHVVKWYTSARKFPQLIGRTPDGARIIGGPYTITQAIGAGLILVIGLNTMSLWAHYGLIGNVAVLTLVTWGSVWGLGRIPVGSRNPLSVVSGAWRAIGAPRTGRVGGRPVRIRRPRHLQHRIVFAVSDLPDLGVSSDLIEVPTSPKPGTARRRKPSAKPRPAAGAAHKAPAAQPNPMPARQPALTGVQALLAGKALPNEESHR